MHRFKPLWSTFNSLHKTSGSNTLAPLPSTSGPLRHRSHETKTSSAPHASSDEVLPASGESVTTSLGDASVPSYRGTVRHFLAYLGAQYPEVHSLEPRRRVSHILGWVWVLWSSFRTVARSCV